MFGNVDFASDFDTALIYLYNLLKQKQHQIQNHLARLANQKRNHSGIQIGFCNTILRPFYS